MVIFDLSVGDLHWANIYLLVHSVAEGILYLMLGGQWWYEALTVEGLAGLERTNYPN